MGLAFLRLNFKNITKLFNEGMTNFIRIDRIRSQSGEQQKGPLSTCSTKSRRGTGRALLGLVPGRHPIGGQQVPPPRVWREDAHP